MPRKATKRKPGSEATEHALTIRFPIHLWNAVVELADAHHRSVSGEVLRAVEEYLARFGKVKLPGEVLPPPKS